MCKFYKTLKARGMTGILVCLILFCTLVFSMSAFASYPEKQMERFLKVGSYEKAVNVFNEHFVDSVKKQQYEEVFLNEIQQIKTEWKQGKVHYKDAVLLLQEFVAIENQNISSTAKEMMRFISVEGKGMEYYTLASTLFEEGDYINAMRYLKHIDESYLGYADVEMFYKRCVNVIIICTKTLDSIEQMENWIEKLERYYEIVPEISFLTRKEQLEQEVEVAKSVLDILNQVSFYYDERSYKNAFYILQDGMKKYPDSTQISSAYETYCNRYVEHITKEVELACESKSYDEAYEILDQAMDALECEAFYQLLEYVKEEENFLYRWKNNIIHFFELF